MFRWTPWVTVDSMNRVHVWEESIQHRPYTLVWPVHLSFYLFLVYPLSHYSEYFSSDIAKIVEVKQDLALFVLLNLCWGTPAWEGWEASQLCCTVTFQDTTAPARVRNHLCALEESSHYSYWEIAQCCCWSVRSKWTDKSTSCWGAEPTCLALGRDAVGSSLLESTEGQKI